MRLSFNVTPDDARRASEFFARWDRTPFVVRRRERNVEGKRPPVDRPAFWKATIGCQLTTQQRSGPDSAVARFDRSAPYPLTLDACRGADDLPAFVTGTLTTFGGIRRTGVIGAEVAKNLAWLDGGGWSQVEAGVASLERPHDHEPERAAAQVLGAHLSGLGPKQSRNVLQKLGLTQHEVPIDSRLTKWLNDFGFPFHLSAKGLGDPAYYGVVSDGFRELCAAAGVLPCLMDAAIFASFDGEEDEVSG